MKFRLLALLLCALFLLSSCGRPDESPPDTDPAADPSAERLEEAMAIDAAHSAALLDLLATLGYEGEVLVVFPAEDGEGLTYFHVWLGESAVDIYLQEDGRPAAILSGGILLYGAIPAPVEPDYPTTLTLVEATEAVQAGAKGKVALTGTPGVEYTIHVIYSGGPSTAKGLEPQVAGEDGSLTWEWTVSANVAAGDYRITVFCTDQPLDALTWDFAVLPRPTTPEDPPEVPAEMTLTLSDYTATIPAGSQGRVEVVGRPGEQYEIKVYYSGGASAARGLEPQVADGEGRLSWTWTVSTNVTPGEYTILVRRVSDQRDELELAFTVTEKQPESDPPDPPPVEQTLTLVDHTAQVIAGQTGMVSVLGLPDTTYRIRVYYASGPSSAKGLEDQTAGADGSITWEWKVAKTVTPGDYRIVISRSDQPEDALTLPFTVLAPSSENGN